MTWVFDDSVAERFESEAEKNIPDYSRVISLCKQIVDNNFSKESKIVDVGSALGNTLNHFYDSGYKNVIGIESSQSMIDRSSHKDKIIHSVVYPKDVKADVVLANWTLHFIHDRENYIRQVYKSINDGGIFILSEKTTQTDVVKQLYYDFKRSNGVSEEYIHSKEKALENVLVTYPAWWYFDCLQLAGFKNIQVINAKYGFVTYYCEK